MARLDNGEHILDLNGPIRFPERLQEITCLFRLRARLFPEPGIHQFRLLADGRWVAQKRLTVYRRED